MRDILWQNQPIITRNFSVRYTLVNCFVLPFFVKIRFSIELLGFYMRIPFFIHSPFHLIRCGVFMQFRWLLSKKFLHWISSPVPINFASILWVFQINFLALLHFFRIFFVHAFAKQIHVSILLPPFLFVAMTHKKRRNILEKSLSETNKISIKLNDAHTCSADSNGKMFAWLYTLNVHYLSHHLI